MNEVEQFVDAYLAQLKRRGASPHTPIKYRPFLTRFAAWADERELGTITAAQIELDYLAEWHDAFASAHGRRPSPDTQRNHIVALRGFFRWALRFDMIERDPMVKID